MGCPPVGDPPEGYDQDGYENTARGLHVYSGLTRQGLNLLNEYPAEQQPTNIDTTAAHAVQPVIGLEDFVNDFNEFFELQPVQIWDDIPDVQEAHTAVASQNQEVEEGIVELVEEED